MANHDPQEFWNWVRSRGVAMVCPACGTDDQWNIAATPVGLPYDLGHQLDLQNGYRAVPTWCQHCGYMRFFSLTPYTGDEGDAYTPPTTIPGLD